MWSRGAQQYSHLNLQVADDVDDVVVPANFNITSNASKVGGDIEITIALSEGDTITIARLLPFTRVIDYVKRGTFTAKNINDDQDYQSYLLQDLNSYSSLFLRMPLSSNAEDLIFPAPSNDEAFIRWDSEGKLINDETMPDSVAVAITSAWESEADALTSKSYATEAEDVEVKVYTSNNDGTFTATAQTGIYSALHHEIKSATWNPDSYYNKVALDGGQLDNRYYTETEQDVTDDAQDVAIGLRATISYVDSALSDKIDLDNSTQTKIGNLIVGQEISIVSWSFSTTTITINTATAHNLLVGHSVTIKGLVSTTNAPNGIYTVVSVVDSDTFTFTALEPTGTPTVSSATLTSGTIEAKDGFKGKNAFTAWALFLASDGSLIDSYNVKDTIVRHIAGRYTFEVEKQLNSTDFIVFVNGQRSTGLTSVQGSMSRTDIHTKNVDNIMIQTWDGTTTADALHVFVAVLGGME